MDTKERRNLYRILHVQPEAPTEVLKASYRALMGTARVHPDLGGDTDRAALINHAYSVLSDPERRQAYDRSLARPTGPSSRSAGADADPARWAADRHRMYCPFCRTLLEPAVAADDGCPRCGAPLSMPPQAPPERAELIGRRRSPRVDRREQALLRLPESAEDFVVQVQDLSFNGIALESGVAVRESQAVRVLATAFDAVAQVLQCRRAPGRGFTLHGRLLTMRLRRRAGAYVDARC
jgi:curved DNA-binding protein CbpA